MPALSYEAYPTIFDNIVAGVDFATELTLRLCCKSLRDAVDHQQARHVVLTPSGKDNTSVRGIIFRIAALRRLCPKSTSQLPAITRELLQHVRVLDIRGFFPATCNLTQLKDALPNLDTMRLCTRKGAYTPMFPSVPAPWWSSPLPTAATATPRLTSTKGRTATSCSSCRASRQ